MQSRDTNGDTLDFFISYTTVDESWAEWIAWQLEANGYSCVIQAWDFVAGSHFIEQMHQAVQKAGRTIAVLSNAYLASAFAAAEWQEAWRRDPRGNEARLLVFRVEDCPRPGLLGQVVSVDLFDLEESAAASRLLQAVQHERRKPALPPLFPHTQTAQAAAQMDEPQFPGRLVPGTVEEAANATGPMSRDNPVAVALAFWTAILNEDLADLQEWITPESRGNWDVRALRIRSEGLGLATGVHSPRHDVAYVKLIELQELEVAHEGPLHIVDGDIEIRAMIISLIRRPELGGWRVHGIGLPVEPQDLPRGP
jgi:hypothetical protein